MAIMGAAAAVLLAAGSAPAQRAGDCDGDLRVTVDELVRGVNIALGGAALSTYRSVDVTSDGNVTADEIVLAVNAALFGCTSSAPSPTPTRTPTPTSRPAASPTPTAVAVPGCSDGVIRSTFTDATNMNATPTPAEPTLVRGAMQVRDSRTGLYAWSTVGNLCHPEAGLLRSVEIGVVGVRTGFAPGSYPITPPLSRLNYVETPEAGVPQPRIRETTGASLVIEAVEGSRFRFRITGAPMTPNRIIAGNPPPQRTFRLNVTGTIERFTSS